MAARNSAKTLLPGVKNFLIRGKSGGFRSMTTSAVKNHKPEEGSALDIDRSARQAPVVIPIDLPSETWDPLFPARSLSNLANIFDVFASPLLGVGGGARKAWDVVEDKEALRVRVDMPGLAKEDVSIRVEGNSLMIEGEAKGGVELDGSGRRYMSRIDLPGNVYKLDQIKAEMKDGVLKITVPKVKEEEMKNVITVPIEE